MKTLFKIIFPIATIFFPSSLPANPSYKNLFPEKILTVTETSDGYRPGNLRTALLQANSLRQSNPFLRVRITFADNVTELTLRTPLPALEQGFTTLDCRTPSGRFVTLRSPASNSETKSAEGSSYGLRIASSNNRVFGCRVLGFPGAGILLDAGAGFNRIESSELSQNRGAGIEMTSQAGKGNVFTANRFRKNSLQPIRNPKPGATDTRLEKLSNTDTVALKGKTRPRSNVEIAAFNPETEEIKPLDLFAQADERGDFFVKVPREMGAGISGFAALGVDAQGNTGEWSVPTSQATTRQLPPELENLRPSSNTPNPSRPTRRGKPSFYRSLEDLEKTH